MKSKTSFFHKTVFKKDITRFAPAWGAYAIVLALALLSIADNRNTYDRVQNIKTAINTVSWANLIYGGAVAQLLFGDLYNSRMCGALHAMPVNRETFFGSHTAAAIAFAFVPNVLIALIALPVLQLGVGWSAVLWWLLAACLQYLYFLGTAVLCVMLAGNRFGQLALYAMVIFAGLAAAWLASSIYEPLLYGIRFDLKAFYPFCPLAEFSQLSKTLILDYGEVRDEAQNFLRYELYGVAPGEGWGYMALCAGVGILALLGALALYRRRRLECAGDFVAFSHMRPAVLVLVTVFAGGFFHVFGDAFGMNMKYVLVFCGMAVGYFACRMMLERTTRVFRKKAFLGCGIIMAVFGMTMGLTLLDPVGVTRYVPEAAEVESVTFSRGYGLQNHGEYVYSVTEEADVAALIGVHEDCVDRSAGTADVQERYSMLDIRLEYKLKDGKTVNRFYSIHPLSEAGQVLKGYFTRTKCVLGITEAEIPAFADIVRYLYTDGRLDGYKLDGLDLEGLLLAIDADCKAGNMAQFNSYHYPSDYDLQEGVYDKIVTHLEIGWDQSKLDAMEPREGRFAYRNLRVYASCVNTIRWLEAHDLLTEEQQKEFVHWYDDTFVYDDTYFSWD